MGLRKERKVLNFKNIFIATFAKNLCTFAVKKLLIQPLIAIRLYHHSV